MIWSCLAYCLYGGHKREPAGKEEAKYIRSPTWCPCPIPKKFHDSVAATRPAGPAWITIHKYIYCTEWHRMAQNGTKWHKMALEWHKMAQKWPHPSGVAGTSQECQVVVSPRFYPAMGHLRRAANPTVGEEKTARNRQRPLFVTKMAHCTTRCGGIGGGRDWWEY